MSFVGGSFGFGTGPVAGNRFARTPGRIQGSLVQGVNYPSPFFDVAHTYLPATVKQMFRWCRYYFLINPLINATVFKLSEYPITDLIIDHEDPDVRKKWTEYLQEDLRIRPYQVECGLDYHCLAGETLVTTMSGVFPIRELAGRTVQVLSEGGQYRPATFRSYGIQRLWEVHVDNSVLYATEEHEWVVAGCKKRCLTRDLRGRAVPRVTASYRPAKDDDFWTGVRHGIVFGDGTLSNEGRQAHVLFHTEEKKALAVYFEGHGTISPHHEDKYLGVYGQPPHFKQLPSEEASSSYWYGFTAGLLATDGSVDVRGDTTLTQKDPIPLLEIQKRLPWMGLLGGKVREHTAWNSFTEQMESMNYLGLKRQSLQPEDFIRPDQRDRFVSNFKKTSYGQYAQVKKVVPTNRVEEVFCCVEPETHSFVIEGGLLTGNCYGNSMMSLGFPFKKYLTCAVCRFQERADKIRHRWVFTNYTFRLTCPACGSVTEAGAKDIYQKNASGINLIRWNCEHVEVNYNDISGETTYFYTIPQTVRNDVVIGKKDVVESVPQVFIQAMRQQKGVVFSKDNFFHMKRATLAQQDRGWGIPLLLPVLKDTFYLQIMKKAQEAILLEHIVPLRILFPQAGSGSSDPYCLTADTLVEANLGYRRAEDVQKGDLIKTAYGNYSPVTAVKKRAVRAGESVFRLTVTGMSSVPVEASEEHPFLVVKAGGKYRGRIKNWLPQWVEAKDLNEGDYVAYPISRSINSRLRVDVAEYLSSYVSTDGWVYRQITPSGAEVYEYVEAREQRRFADGELQELAAKKGWSAPTLQTTASRFRRGHRTSRMQRYLPWSKALARIVGYYLAEGCVDAGRITFSLHASETWICDELDEAFAEILGKKGVRKPHQENGLSYQVSDSIFAEFIQNFCGHLAWNKTFPKKVVQLPREILLELVRCMINGDGGAENMYRNNGTGRMCRTSSVTYTTTSLDLALKLRELLLYLGVVGRVHTTPIRVRTKHPIHRVKVNGAQAVKLWKLLGWDVGKAVVKKDTSRCFIRGGYAFFRVQKKEVLQEVDYVYGFQVDGDKSFCVPSCATHNTTINISAWRDHVASEIARWRLDNNHIPIMPLPLGNQTIGGDGRALLLTQEIQAWSDQIMVGMGVPREFLLGGMSYAGTNVSMRMLENAFLGYILRQKQMINWVIKMVASYMDWPLVRARFKPFKMADDIQRKAYRFQLNQAQKISDTTLLADEDLEQAEEDEIMVQETAKRLEATKKQQLAMAHVQAEAQVVMAKAQVKAQQIAQDAMTAPTAPGEPGDDLAGGQLPPEMQSPLGAEQDMGQQGQPQEGRQAPGMSIVDLAQTLAAQLVQMPPEQQQMALQNIASQNPELAKLVQQFAQQMQAEQPQGMGGATGASVSQVDMRPLPEQRGPRREAALV